VRKGFPAAGLLLLPLLALRCSSSTKTKTSAEVLLNERMATVLLRDGRYLEAESAFRDALKSDPKNADLYDGLGVSLLAQGKTKEALDALDRTIKLSPEKVAYRIHRAVARTEAGRYAEAEEDFKWADVSPATEDRLEVAINRGRLRQRQGDFSRAEADFAAALLLDPKSFPAMMGRGVARESKGDIGAAAEDYLEAVRLDPKSALANLRLGLVLVTMKKYALGRRYLERALELDPEGDAGSKARVLLDSTPVSRSP
jgi:tetratricopeptide (TPR) repeat protein